MFKNVKPIFLKAISGIHAGAGTDLGLVDLPIQRERHTGLPKIESSGLKGCIRDAFEQIKGDLPSDDFIDIAFGPEDDGDKHAGSVAFTDARILLFPVRSAKGIFAYATCPYVLNRLKEDFALAGITVSDIVSIIINEMESNKTALVSSDRLVFPGTGKVVLEEFTFSVAKSDNVAKFAEVIYNWMNLDYSQYIQNNLLILNDDDFMDFTKNNTEIITRIRIDNDTGTVAKGALFTEELLPAETVLYSLVMASRIFIDKDAREASETVKNSASDEGKFLLDTLADKMPKYIQIGGDASIGKGLCRVNVNIGGNYVTGNN